MYFKLSEPMDRRKISGEGRGCDCVGLPLLEQAGNLAVLVHVDALGSGDLRQAGHGHDLTGEGNEEACARGDLDIAHGDGEALRRASFAGSSEKEYCVLAMQMGILS